MLRDARRGHRVGRARPGVDDRRPAGEVERLGIEEREDPGPIEGVSDERHPRSEVDGLDRGAERVRRQRCKRELHGAGDARLHGTFKRIAGDRGPGRTAVVDVRYPGFGVADDIAVDRGSGRAVEEDRTPSGDAGIVDSEAPDGHTRGRHGHRGSCPGAEECRRRAPGSRHKGQILLVEVDRAGVTAGGHEDRVASGRRMDRSLDGGKAVPDPHQERGRASGGEADDFDAREGARACRDDPRQARDRDGRSADRDRVIGRTSRQSDRVDPCPTVDGVRPAAELERVGSVGPLEGIDRAAGDERVGPGIAGKRVPQSAAEHPLDALCRRRLIGVVNGRRQPERQISTGDHLDRRRRQVDRDGSSEVGEVERVAAVSSVR